MQPYIIVLVTKKNLILGLHKPISIIIITKITNQKNHATCYPSRFIIFPMNKSIKILISFPIGTNQVHIIHFNYV
jgi:hypothetical protein